MGWAGKDALRALGLAGCTFLKEAHYDLDVLFGVVLDEPRNHLDYMGSCGHNGRSQDRSIEPTL